MRILVVIALLISGFVSAVSQQPAGETRAETMAATFNKHKEAVKEKNGIRHEKYKDVHSELVVKPNAGDYAGVYEAGELGYVINIQIGSDGRVQANGSDNGRTFRLENVKLAGGLLTGSKIYQDGATEKFEGVFLNRTERNSPTDAGVTSFGLGVVPETPVTLGGQTYDKLFYQLKH